MFQSPPTGKKHVKSNSHQLFYHVCIMCIYVYTMSFLSNKFKQTSHGTYLSTSQQQSLHRLRWPSLIHGLALVAFAAARLMPGILGEIWRDFMAQSGASKMVWSWFGRGDHILKHQTIFGAQYWDKIHDHEIQWGYQLWLIIGLSSFFNGDIIGEARNCGSENGELLPKNSMAIS